MVMVTVTVTKYSNIGYWAIMSKRFSTKVYLHATLKHNFKKKCPLCHFKLLQCQKFLTEHFNLKKSFLVPKLREILFIYQNILNPKTIYKSTEIFWHSISIFENGCRHFLDFCPSVHAPPPLGWCMLLLDFALSRTYSVHNSVYFCT